MPSRTRDLGICELNTLYRWCRSRGLACTKHTAGEDSSYRISLEGRDAPVFTLATEADHFRLRNGGGDLIAAGDDLRSMLDQFAEATF